MGNQASYMRVQDLEIEILPWFKAHKYLGRMINLGAQDRISFEISARISAAWGAYHKYKKTL
eukprot:8853758-Karenia_brevis.AAC.1